MSVATDVKSVATDVKSVATDVKSVATAANLVANSSPDEIVGILLPSAGFKAYVRRLADAPRPAAPDLLRAALLAEIREQPRDERKGHMIAAVSCFATGEAIPLDDETYAASLAKAKPTEMDRLFKAACHLNGFAVLEVLD